MVRRTGDGPAAGDGTFQGAVQALLHLSLRPARSHADRPGPGGPALLALHLHRLG